MTKKTILTGLRANNDLTLGNYLGGVLPIVEMAKRRLNDYQINMFVPDLHSITTPSDYSRLHSRIFSAAKIFTAAGLPIESDNVFLYRQSYIPAHSELTWLLDCFTGFGEMSRMTQFKDKSQTIGSERTSVGLFNYPVLMAADILLYNTTYVPVGDDQKQHLEFTRDIALRINHEFGDIFTVPEPMSRQLEFFGKEKALRIKDLVNPHKKMSKSDENGRGVIYLNDDPAAAAKKIMSATTDDIAVVRYEPSSQPGISNLLEILALVQNKSLNEVTAEHEGMTRYGDFKRIIAAEIEAFLIDLQNKIAAITDASLLQKFEASEAAMAITANETVKRMQHAVGLRPPKEHRD